MSSIYQHQSAPSCCLSLTFGRVRVTFWLQNSYLVGAWEVSGEWSVYHVSLLVIGQVDCSNEHGVTLRWLWSLAHLFGSLSQWSIQEHSWSPYQTFSLISQCSGNSKDIFKFDWDKLRNGHVWQMIDTDEWFFFFFVLSVWNRILWAFWRWCSPSQHFLLEWPVKIIVDSWPRLLRYILWKGLGFVK